MRKHWLVLAHSDFQKPIRLSQATDLVDEAEADCIATDWVQELKEPWAYVYELRRVYRPHPKEPTKEAEIVYVDA